MGHSFLEVWGVTFSGFHHFPIFICGADAPRTGRVRCRSGVGAVSERCRNGVGAVSERCQKGGFSLFKIEVEGDHAECGFVDALGVDFLCGVGEVVACFL